MQIIKRPPPPFLVWLMATFMWLLAQLEPAYDVSMLLRYSLFGLITLIAVCIGALGVLACKQANTTINPLRPDSTQALVTTGIYKYSRNPMYLGLVLILFGWSVFLCSFLSFIGIVLFVVYMNRYQIFDEETALAKKFNGAFLKYKSTTRKWI